MIGRIYKSILCLALAAAFCMSVPAVAATDMLAVDHALYELGYRDVNCSGVLNAKMVTALKNFQYVNGLTVSGEVDDETVRLLLHGNPTSKHAYLAGMARNYTNAESLKNGDYGNEVSRMQRKLKDLGYFSGKSDGAFGDATQAAVVQFQTANGLTANGIADGRTMIRLYEGTPVTRESFLQSVCASVGDSSAGVRNVQRRLKALGYFSGECTGKFGDGTQQAVKQFRQKNDLPDSGDVDEECALRLFFDAAAPNGAASLIMRSSSAETVTLLNGRLRELGYPVGEDFDIQTEIALMEFQLVNGMEVNSAADSETYRRIQETDAAPLASYDWKNTALTANDDIRARITKTATALLGQKLDFTNDLEFVQYVLLRCSVPFFGSEQVHVKQITDVSTLPGGSVVCFEGEGVERNGIATADGAVIYLADSGYIVMSYFRALGEAKLSVWTMKEIA